MPRKAAQISLNSQEGEILQKIVRSRTYGKDIQARSQIVLAAAEGLSRQPPKTSQARRLRSEKSGVYSDK